MERNRIATVAYRATPHSNWICTSINIPDHVPDTRPAMNLYCQKAIYDRMCYLESIEVELDTVTESYCDETLNFDRKAFIQFTDKSWSNIKHSAEIEVPDTIEKTDFAVEAFIKDCLNIILDNPKYLDFKISRVVNL